MTYETYKQAYMMGAKEALDVCSGDYLCAEYTRAKYVVDSLDDAVIKVSYTDGKEIIDAINDGYNSVMDSVLLD